MFHYFNTLTNTRGDSLVGYQVRLFTVDETPSPVPIYADENSTPIVSVSGIENAAVTDEGGNYDFFVNDGTYTIHFYTPGGEYLNRVRWVPMIGDLSGAVGDVEGIRDEAINAKDQAIDARDASVAASEDSEAQVALAAAQRTLSETARAQSQGFALTAEAQADRADAAVLAAGTYPNAYATALPQGVTATTITAPGSGYTPGTYALGVSGGPAGFAGTYTVEGGGTVASIAITNPGLATTNTAPTLSFPSGGGTGATATATVSSLIPNQGFYNAALSESRGVGRFRNNAGSVEAASNPDGSQIAFPQKTLIDEALRNQSPLLNTAILASNPEFLRVLPGMRLPLDAPRMGFQFWVRDNGGARLIARLQEIDTPSRIWFVGVFNSNIDPTTDPNANGGVGKATLPIFNPEGEEVGEFQVDWRDGGTFGAPVTFDPEDAEINLAATRFSASDRATVESIIDTKLSDQSGAWADATATSLDAYLRRIIRNIFLWSAKAHDYRVSFAQTSATLLVVDIWDEQLGGPVGYFELENPNYAALPDRILITPSNRLPGVHPVTAGYSGIEGYLDLNQTQAAYVVSNAAYSFTDPAVSRIKRTNIAKRLSYRSRHWADDFEEVIQVGAGRALTTMRTAFTSVYDGGALANYTNSAQLPTCKRANPYHRIAFVFDPGTYTGVSEHLPDWCYVGGLYRDATVIEHSPTATSSIIEGQANSGAFDITFRTRVPASAQAGAGASSCYAWHSDFVHLLTSPDSAGDVLRWYTNIFKRVRWIVGPEGTIQAYGAGIGVNNEAIFEDCELLCENPAYGGAIVSANNSSGTIGGGRLTLRNTWDRTGRGADAAAVAVQGKTNATYPNIVNIDGRGITRVARTGDFPAKWLITGDNSAVFG